MPEHSGKGEVFHTFHSILPLRRAVEHLPNLQMLSSIVGQPRVDATSTAGASLQATCDGLHQFHHVFIHVDEPQIDIILVTQCGCPSL